MSDAIHTSVLHRLWNTPLRDALHGQFTCRLDWRARLAAVNLPGPAREMITRVIQRTRLWRIEKSEVADELSAHFLDALQSGEKIEAAIAAFGNERQAAKLIRRARVRNRPLLWRAMRWARRAVCLLIVAYGMLALTFFLSHPQPKIDYVAELNRPIAAVPEADRAWPVYRQVILTLLNHHPLDAAGNQANLPGWVGANVDGKHWPEAQAWLGAHAGEVESLRAATAKPVLGFVLGPDGTVNDEERWPGMGARARKSWNDFPSLISIQLPYFSDVRAMAFILEADAKLAQTDRDGARLERDIDAILGLSDQLHNQDRFLITNMVSVGMDAIALDSIERALQMDPAVLTDQQLIRLAHRISKPRTASDLFTFDAERFTFYDLVQRSYSDDGHGDGHLTAEGVRCMGLVSSLVNTHDSDFTADSAAAYAVGPAAMAISASRKQLLEEYDQLIGHAENNLHLPARDATWDTQSEFAKECSESFFLAEVRYGSILAIEPAVANVSEFGERYLGRRDGVATAIALELYRRQNRAYPQHLDELPPLFMPVIPADRITGDPIKYRLKDGRPLLYSVGIDRIDDGGTPAERNRDPYPTDAARWWLHPGEAVPRGDWILYPVPARPDPD